jgi:hypothetical protein
MTVLLTGTREMLISNPITMINPFSPESREIKALAAKRKKTDEEQMELFRIKHRAALYIDETGPFLPGYNFHRSFQDAARLSKQGKTWERGVEVGPDRVYIQYRGPRDAEGLWEDKTFVDWRDGKVANGSRIPIVRPKFPIGWQAEVRIDFQASNANADELLSHIETAGLMIGVGTYRARYGRFSMRLVDSNVRGLDKTRRAA